MLFLAFLCCSWLGAWRAEKEGVPRSYLLDVVVWLFLGGIFGARVTYMIQYHVPISQFFVIWKGGLVFYGSFFGGIISYGIWRAAQEGLAVLRENRARLTRWSVVGAVAGGLFFYFNPLLALPTGLVFGAALGALVGFSFAYILVIQKYAPLNWKFMDIMTPCVALGLALGRIGCLLNGCCFGNVACAQCPAIHFPLCAPSRTAYTQLGYQTAAGFTVEEGGNDPRTRVGAIEPHSPAADAGLRPGDRITALNGIDNRILVEIYRGADDAAWNQALKYLHTKQAGRTVRMVSPTQARIYYDEPTLAFREDLARLRGPEWHRGVFVASVTDVFQDLLVNNWPQGETHLALSVLHDDAATPVALPTFRPLTLGLHPTQIYETISALLILLLLTAYYPYRRRDGEIFVLFMVCYSIHRFVNEALRNDTAPVFAGMTLSQNVSILVLTIAVVLLIYLRTRPTALEPTLGATAPGAA
jgi:prolipoprotein diacylglyceryltransferase